MENKELNKEVKAGLFFVAGILLLVSFIVILGGNKGLAQSKFQVTVLYRNVGGLMEGAPARLSGVNVGTVHRVNFLNEEVEGRRVEVKLNVLSKYKKQLQGRNLRFVIKTEGILGEKLIEIDILNTGPMVDLTKPIIGEDPLDVQDMAQVFAQAAQSFTETANQLTKIDIVSLTEVMEESSKSFLKTADELKEISKKTKRLLDRIEQKVIDGNLFKVF